MHERVRAHIERYLTRPDQVPDEFVSHMGECSECAAEVDAMAAHSRVIRSLRAESDVEPAPGFYARVMDRIESQRPVSIWSVFLEPAFGRNLAIASAFAAMLMGVFLFSGEPMKGPAPMPLAPASVVAAAEDVPAPALGSNDQQQVRDAVFVSLATFRD